VNRPGKIISGGQTGADFGALRAAKILGIPTGGVMPRHFRTEAGSRPWMATRYGLEEHPSPQYRVRTEVNVQAADITVLFGDVANGGSRLTLVFCREHGKPYLINPSAAALATHDWASTPILNVAGNRESSNKGLEDYVVWLLVLTWGTEEHLGKYPPPKWQPRFSGDRARVEE
jgi:hypothetical protein